MRTVAIIGVGMMGGSLGLALRRKRAARVIGVGRDAKRLSSARKLGACDEATTDMVRGVSDADVVVICTTVAEIVPTLQKISPHLKPGALVCDIGSVKSEIMAGAKEAFSGSRACFIGAHPLAGSEKTGANHSNAGLYHNATVVLCPPAGTPAKAESALRAFWKSVGANSVVMDPEIHDLLVAHTSHLSHVISGAFVELVAGLSRRDKKTPRLLAGSFRDLTRISDSSPEQWEQICVSNGKFIAGALKAYRDILSSCIRDAESGGKGWLAFFSNARRDREKLLTKKARSS